MPVDPVDATLDAAVAAVRSSAAAGANWQVATVASVATDGTITVTTSTGTVPSVRLVCDPMHVADTVVVSQNAAGNWVCNGKLRTAADGTDWTTASLVSGFSHNGNGNGTVQYRRVLMAGALFVQWRGGLQWTSSGGSAPWTLPNAGTFFTVPSGFIALSRRSVPAAMQVQGTTLTGKVDFNTDGTCTIVSQSSINPLWLSLNSVLYSID